MDINNTVYVGHLHLDHSYYHEMRIFNLFDKFNYVAITKESNTDGSNQHYHIMCCNNSDKMPIQLATLKKNITTAFPHLKRSGKGGDHKYSVKLAGGKTPDGVLLTDPLELREFQVYYVFKEVSLTNEPKLKGITIPESLGYYKRYWELKDKNLQLLKDKKSKEQKQKASVLDKLLTKIKDEVSMIGADGNMFMFSDLLLDKTVDVITQFYIDQTTKTTMNNVVLRNQIFTCMFHLDDNFRAQYKDNLKLEFKNNFY